MVVGKVGSVEKGGYLCPKVMESVKEEEGAVIMLKLQQYLEETKCPICHGMLKAPRLVKTCMHRFCKECITKAISDRQKCPVCKTHLGSHRETMEDTRIQRLLEALYGDPIAFENQLDQLNSKQTDVLAQAMRIQKQREQALRAQAKLLWAESNGGIAYYPPPPERRPSRNPPKSRQNGKTDMGGLQKKKSSLNSLIFQSGTSEDNSSNGISSGQKRVGNHELSSSSSDMPIIKRFKRVEYEPSSGSGSLNDKEDVKTNGVEGVKGLPPLKLPRKFMPSRQEELQDQKQQKKIGKLTSQSELVTPKSRLSIQSKQKIGSNSGKIKSKQRTNQLSKKETPQKLPPPPPPPPPPQQLNQVSPQMSDEANIQCMHRIKGLLEEERKQEQIDKKNARICVVIRPLQPNQKELQMPFLYCPPEISVGELAQALEQKLSCQHTQQVQLFAQSDEGPVKLQKRALIKQVSKKIFDWHEDVQLQFTLWDKNRSGGCRNQGGES